MRESPHISSIKTKIIIAAAAILLVLAADWCSPGVGLHRAAVTLGGYGTIITATPSLWDICVRLIGWDVRSLGTFSLVTTLICLSIYLTIVGDFVHYARSIAQFKSSQKTHRYDGLKSSVSILSAAGFLCTPGLLMAATRVDALMLSLVFIFAGLAIMLHDWLFVEDPFLLALKNNKIRSTCALCLLAIGIWEFQAMGRIACFASVRTLAWFVAVSAFPMILFLTLIRVRQIIKKESMTFFLMMWSALIILSGCKAVITTTRGREVSRLIDQIVADAHGCHAILSEGYLDDVLLFTRPKGLRLISLVRDNDEYYRRDLAEWVSQIGRTNLVWAAKIGPRTLIGEWVRTDKADCLRYVRTSAYYFPTIEKWREACALLKKISVGEPLGAYMHKLVSACGNDIGCRYLEENNQAAAWAIFWEILHQLDHNNCTAIANLYAMIKAGYQPLTSERQELEQFNRQAVAFHGSVRSILRAAFSGGRIYVRGINKMTNITADMALIPMRLSLREKEFIKTVSEAPNSTMSADRAREAIRSGVKTQIVRLDKIGPQLLRLDIALNDWKNAEKDALAILDVNVRNASANSILGLIRCRQGNYNAAEFYLRAALREDDTNAAALNDLAVTLTRMGRFDEAVSVATAAVKHQPDDWNFHETLALAQIRGKKNPAEGAATLQKSIQLAKDHGVDTEKVVRFSLDAAWLAKARKDRAALQHTLESLLRRSDLTLLQQAELIELKK